jgi:hypothetical protein
MLILHLVFDCLDGHPAHLIKAHPVDVHLELRTDPLLQYPSVDTELCIIESLHGCHRHLLRHFN